jgi:hypothetical protein
MQVFRSFDHQNAAVAGWGIRVLLLGNNAMEGRAVRHLASLGSSVETTDELYTALSAVIDDPVGYGLFVIDCDGIGGLEAGRKAVQVLNGSGCTVPVILVSAECGEQIFPQDRRAPTMLRAPLSSVAMRVGFEHALRDRFNTRMI